MVAHSPSLSILTFADELGRWARLWLAAGRRLFAAAASPPAAPARRDAPPATVHAKSRPKVLVADDYPTNRKVAELILVGAGIEVVTVEDGAEAVEACEGQAFNVILMDLQMPRMGGLEAISEIRRREAAVGGHRTPILVLSASSAHDQIQAADAAGADGHFGKPFCADALVEAVLRLSQGGSAPLERFPPKRVRFGDQEAL